MTSQLRVLEGRDPNVSFDQSVAHDAKRASPSSKRRRAVWRRGAEREREAVRVQTGSLWSSGWPVDHTDKPRSVRFFRCALCDAFKSGYIYTSIYFTLFFPGVVEKKCKMKYKVSGAAQIGPVVSVWVKCFGLKAVRGFVRGVVTWTVQLLFRVYFVVAAVIS